MRQANSEKYEKKKKQPRTANAYIIKFFDILNEEEMVIQSESRKSGKIKAFDYIKQQSFDFLASQYV